MMRFVFLDLLKIWSIRRYGTCRDLGMMRFGDWAGLEHDEFRRLGRVGARGVWGVRKFGVMRVWGVSWFGA